MIHVGWLLVREHLTQIAKFEQFTDEPLSAADIKAMLDGRKTQGFSAFLGSSLAGYALFGANRKAMSVKRVVVGDDFRREGIGRTLLERICDKASEFNIGRAVAHVPDDNFHLSVHLWLSACGFEARGIEDGKIRFRRIIPVSVRV